jgi:catechol 2,3-dioxygenase-like lactoylglutathione lyase family enzyme
MSAPAILGIHHVKYPVTDIERSRDWYERVFGLETSVEFREDGKLMGVFLGDVGGPSPISLRQAPEHAAGLSGFDVIAWLVEDKAAVERWAAWLDELGIDHSPIIEGGIGWIINFEDPDGTQIRLYTRQRNDGG